MRVETLYFRFGVACIVLALAFAVIAVYGAAAGMHDAPLAGGACAILFFVPGVVFMLYQYRWRELDRQLSELASVLKGYREITMGDLGSKLDVKPDEAELLVAACIGRGYVKGRIVTGEGKFVLAADQEQRRDER